MGLAVVLLATAGCAAQPSATPQAMPSAAASATASLPVQSIAAGCPNPESEVCLGTVTAGTYHSEVFRPPLTFTVPDGWQALEDVSSAYLLVAPGDSLDGVNSGGSDFISLHTNVAAANQTCTTDAEAMSTEPGIATTPEAIADELAARPGLEQTNRRNVSLGGFEGVEFDLRIEDGFTGSCFYEPDVPTVQALVNSYASSFNHPVQAGQTMRLYLLAVAADSTMAIEIDDWGNGHSVDEYSQIVETFQFN